MQKGRLQLHGQFACQVTTTAHNEGKQSASCEFAYVISRVKQTQVSFARKRFCMCTHTQCRKSGLGSVLVE